MRKFNEKKSKWWGRRGIGILSLRRRWPIWGGGVLYARGYVRLN